MNQNENLCTARKKTSIGGQALIEGIMMRGPFTSALAIRKPDHQIEVETWATFKGKKKWYQTTPFIRGTFNFIDSLVTGYKCLMRSAELSGMDDDDTPPSGFEKKLMDLLGDKFFTVLSGFSMVLGMLLAIGAFIVLPTVLVSFLGRFIPSQGTLAIIEGCTKILIFLAYIILVSRTDEIHRVFMYHGAEHKTIACYEAGLELTVENIRIQSRFHPRCGTSFLLIVMLVSIAVFSMVSWESLGMRVLLKFLLLPVVVGISYEIIRMAGRYDNWLTRIISAPGLWLQRFTTCEPDDTMMEVAIAAMKPCIPEDQDADRW